MEIKTENLSIGLIVKNYKEMCLLLEEEIKTGKSRQLQLKDWNRYFKYYKDGNKFIIDEIYSEPKEKIDNRGKSEGSRNNNDVYGEYIDQILLNYLSECEKSIIYTTTNQLSLLAGLINWNYSTAFSNKDKYYNYSYKENNGVINKVAMWDFFGIVKTAIKSIIRSSLKRLAEKGYIDYEESHMLLYENQPRAAREQEEAIIRKIENSVLEEMQVTKNKLQHNDRLRNEYYAEVEKLVQQKIDYVDKVYVGYKIKIKEEITSEDIQEDSRAKVNELFKERTKEKLAKIPIKTKEQVGGYIGKPNPFWGKYKVERLNFNYLIYVDYLIQSLMDLKSKNIKELIINQKVVESYKLEKKKMVKQFIENEDDDMKDIWKNLYIDVLEE